MSRVGKYPVLLPAGVTVNIDKNEIKVKGKNGELVYSSSDSVSVSLEDNKILVVPTNDTKHSRAMWGTTRSILNNYVKGVSDGFKVELEIIGVGFKSAVDKKYLTLALGFSHDIKLKIPSGVSVKCLSPTLIELFGVDKQKVGQYASIIRRLRKPEPYKGKGVRYKNEFVRRKEGKKK